MYRTGTVSIAQGSKTLTGVGTQWKTVANILAGYLITFDESRFYEITSVGSDTSLQLESLIDGLGYQGESLTNAKYVITFPLQSGIASNIALNTLKLQEKWQQRERDITGWMSTDATSHLVESYTGNKVSIISLQELTRLVNAGQYPGANAWLDGNGAPDNSIGTEGVFYLDTSTGTIYRKGATQWSVLFTIEGGSGSGGGLTESEVLAITHPSLSANILNTLITLNQSTSDLAEADTNQSEALGVAIEEVTQNYRDADADIMEKASESNPAPKLDLLNHEFETLRYPKITIGNAIPTQSPNNKNEWVLDEIRDTLHVAMIDRYLPMPDVVESRHFAIFTRGWFIRLNSAYTGDIKLRVYPVQNGGNGLPGNPVLANNQWHDITVSVTSLTKIGQWIDGGDDYYFTGIIDTVRLVGLGKHATLDRDESHSYSLGGYIDYQFSTPSWSIFRKFNKKTDGLWYSEDLTPQTPSEIGGSWVQSPTDYRTYIVTAASGSSDALQPFADDTYEHYTTIVILKTSNLVNDLAVTENNAVALRVVEDGTEKFILENVRMYLKRTNSNTPVSGTVTIDSIHAVLAND